MGGKFNSIAPPQSTFIIPTSVPILIILPFCTAKCCLLLEDQKKLLLRDDHKVLILHTEKEDLAQMGLKKDNVTFY
jgi:hypothetical protein